MLHCKRDADIQRLTLLKGLQADKLLKTMLPINLYINLQTSFVPSSEHRKLRDGGGGWFTICARNLSMAEGNYSETMVRMPSEVNISIQWSTIKISKTIRYSLQKILNRKPFLLSGTSCSNFWNAVPIFEYDWTRNSFK